MKGDKRTVPKWYAGDGVDAPQLTYVAEGAEFPDPDTDAHGRKLYADHHHETWGDARAEMVVQASAGVQLDTRSLLDAERNLMTRQARLAEQCKELFRLQQLDDPTEVES